MARVTAARSLFGVTIGMFGKEGGYGRGSYSARCDKRL